MAILPQTQRRIVTAGGQVEVGTDGTVVYDEKPVLLPGLDPDDRTARDSDGYVSFPAPAYATADVQFRTSVGTQAGNDDPDSLDSVWCSGWNYGARYAQIDPTLGSVGFGLEASFGPSPGVIYCEWHALFTPPGGVQRRPFTFTGQWDTGQVSAEMRATAGSLTYVSADGLSETALIEWSADTILFQRGQGWRYLTQNLPWCFQNDQNDEPVALPFVLAAGSLSGYLKLGYHFNGDTVSALARGLLLEARTAASVPIPPAGYQVQFLDSADSAMKTKDTAGIVAPLGHTYVPYTISSSADVDGPAGASLEVLIRDGTNGGTASVLYENALTPDVRQVAGAPTTFVTGTPGANEIQVKNKTGNGGVAFRAGSGRNGAVLYTLTTNVP